jgi:hypothetical protein
MSPLPDLSALDLGPPTGPVVTYELPQRAQWDLIRSEAARQTRQRTRIRDAGRDQCSVTLEELEHGEEVYEFPESRVRVSLRGIYEYWVRRRAQTPPLPPNNPCNPPEVVPWTEVVAVARALGFPDLGPGSIANPAPPMNAVGNHEQGSYLRTGGVVERMHGEDLIAAIQSGFVPRLPTTPGAEGAARMANALPRMLRGPEGAELIRQHMAEAALRGERAEFSNIGGAVRYRWTGEWTDAAGDERATQMHDLIIDIRAPQGSLFAEQLHRLFLDDGGDQNNDRTRPIGALTSQLVANLIARALSQALGHEATWLARTLPRMFERRHHVPNLTENAGNAIDYWFVFPFMPGRRADPADRQTSRLMIRLPIWLIALEDFRTSLNEFTIPYFPGERWPREAEHSRWATPEIEVATEDRTTPMMQLVMVAHTAVQILLGFLFSRPEHSTSMVGFLAPVIRPVPIGNPELLGEVEGRMLVYNDDRACELALDPGYGGRDRYGGFVGPVYKLKNLVAATLSDDETPDWIVDSDFRPARPYAPDDLTRRVGGALVNRPERRVETSTFEYLGRDGRRVEAEMRVPTWIVQYKRGVVPQEDYSYVSDPSVRRAPGE